VGAVEGMALCSWFVRCGDACREREVQPQGNGEMQLEEIFLDTWNTCVGASAI
jgi:hypothetical protein